MFVKVSFESVGDFDATMKWLKDSKGLPKNIMEKAGMSGVAALKLNTPIGDTGETSQGWEYRIETNEANGTIELDFVNNSHPEAYVNIAKIIETGHATKNGGYVPPRPPRIPP